MTAKAPRVALIEDDPAIAEVLSLHLRRAGCDIRQYGDGRSALRDTDSFWPDLVILDLRLPGMDGFEVLQRLRAERDVPVLVLTARGETRDKLQGFRLGADDYVVKPFDPEELLARVRALLRRAGHLVDDVLTLGELRVDRGAYTVQVRGRSVPLSRREVDLLFVLAGSPGRAFTRGQLLDQVWGLEADVDERTVDAFVTRLRRKLQEAWGGNAQPPWRIETVWGVGYKLVADR
ncbi:MAG TPA: response regulator transcription factor [Bacillota bacterium]|nr:response regulator transcription factor [Bacillota bacterium]